MIWHKILPNGISLAIVKPTASLDGDPQAREYVIRAQYPGFKKSIPSCRITPDVRVLEVFPNDMSPEYFDVHSTVQEYRDEILVALVMNS